MTAARGVLETLAALAAVVLLAAAMLVVVGVNPGIAADALARGAFGDVRAIENTLIRLCPLLLVGLAVAMAFRAGVWNIGGEGQICVGALLATAVATRWLPSAPGFVLLPSVLIAGAAAGAMLAGIAATLRVTRGVSEVLSTLMLNFIAVLAVSWAVHGPLEELAGGYPQSDRLPDAARLGTVPGLVRVHWGIVIALLAPLLAWWMLFRTAMGLRLRAVGLGARAARYAGIVPERETLRVMAISGGLAGLAGALEVAGVTGRLFEKIAGGYGFSAIAVALLARLHPLAVIPAAVVFAALATGSGAMQRSAGVPPVAVHVIEGLIILLSVGSIRLGRAR
jgi:simple sugar transport system permease protein